MDRDWITQEVQTAIQTAAGNGIPVYQGFRPADESIGNVVTWWIEKSDPLESENCTNHILVVRCWCTGDDATDGISARNASRNLAFQIAKNLRYYIIQRENPIRLAIFSPEETARIANREQEEFASRGWEMSFIVQTEEA